MDSPLAAALRRLAPGDGMFSTALPGVRIARADRPIPRMPVFYEPSIVIVGAGRKFGYLGERTYVYDAGNYLVLSVPLPFECETIASPAEPLLAAYLAVDLSVLSELILLGDHPAAEARLPEAVAATPLDARLGEAALRLAETLGDPREAAILGPSIVREITYRVLTGPQGETLRAAAAYHSRFHQIQRALERIHRDYAAEWSVDALAALASMSPSAFHQNFRAVTASSPLQYLKTVRLHKARMLMAQEGLRAGAAAGRVGYESQSQFTREFKRLFGMTPVEDVARVRAVFGIRAPAQ